MNFYNTKASYTDSFGVGEVTDGDCKVKPMAPVAPLKFGVHAEGKFWVLPLALSGQIGRHKVGGKGNWHLHNCALLAAIIKVSSGLW